MTRLSLLALAPLGLGTLAQAQTSLLTVPGRAAGDRLGQSVAATGDVDGDTVADWIVGAPLSDLGGQMSGSALVVSGLTGAVLHELAGDSPGDLLGTSVAGGDLDGDGIGDLVVGAPADDATGTDAGSVYALSGLDGSLLWAAHGTSGGDNFGQSLATVPDTDGDGLPEILVGAWTADGRQPNSGEARLLDGATGALLLTVRGETSYDFFGRSVAGLEDVNGDGIGDLLVGAPGESTAGAGAGAAYLVSGADGAILAVHRGAAAGDGMGTCVAAGGDLDGDGRADLLLAAPGADVSASNAGRVEVRSGASGALLLALDGVDAGDNSGSALAGASDLDGDGVPEIVVGVPAADPNGASSGCARIVSGATGLVLADLLGQQPGGRYGSALACAPDVNGDGLDEVLVGAFGEDPGLGSFTGVLHVVSLGGSTQLVRNYCLSTANSSGVAAVMTSSGAPSVSSNQFSIGVQGAVPSTQGLYFYGSDELQVPFGNGYRCVGGQLFRIAATVTDAGGNSLLPVDLVNPRSEAGRILPGSTWKFQYWYRDTPAGSGSFDLSDGLSVTFLP